MGFPVGAFLEDRSCINSFYFMFFLWKGTVVDPGKLSSAFVSVFTLPRFSFPLWMDVCYTRYMLDVWNVFHIYVDSKYMWMFFSFATYSYAEKLSEIPSSSGFCSVVLTDALCWWWWKYISAWERPNLSVTHYSVFSKLMCYLLLFDVFISILLFYRPTKMSSMSVIEFRLFRSELLAAFFFFFLRYH